MTTRREFIRRLVLTPAVLAWVTQVAGKDESVSRVRFGLITDVHQDVMPDGVARVSAFVKAMEKAKADFIVQLGDFCQPKPSNKEFLEAFHAFRGPHHHVLGNHDMDGGYKREQTVAFYGMTATHYAFDAGPVRFLVLDCNEPGGKAGGYKRFIGAEQLAWLEYELGSSRRPLVIFTHQPLDSNGIENAAAVRAILERYDGKIVAVFSGHSHQDYELLINGVRYIQINSASYVWLPGAAARETFPPEVHKAHPSLRNVAAYRDPLWALVTIDFSKSELLLVGRRSEWVGPDPWQRGAPAKDYPRDKNRPRISDRHAKLPIS